MPILLARLRLSAFFTLLWAARFNAAVSGPVGALSASKKMVLVFYGHPLSLPANRMIEQGLTTVSSSVDADLEVFSDLTRFPAVRYGDDIVSNYSVR